MRGLLRREFFDGEGGGSKDLIKDEIIDLFELIIRAPIGFGWEITNKLVSGIRNNGVENCVSIINTGLAGSAVGVGQTESNGVDGDLLVGLKGVSEIHGGEGTGCVASRVDTVVACLITGIGLLGSGKTVSEHNDDLATVWLGSAGVKYLLAK